MWGCRGSGSSSFCVLPGAISRARACHAPTRSLSVLSIIRSALFLPDSLSHTQSPRRVPPACNLPGAFLSWRSFRPNFGDKCARVYQISPKYQLEAHRPVAFGDLYSLTPQISPKFWLDTLCRADFGDIYSHTPQISPNSRLMPSRLPDFGDFRPHFPAVSPK